MIRILTYMAILLLLTGCSNTRELVFGEKENIGAIFWSSKKSCVVGIGSPDAPYNNTPKIKICIADEIIFDSKNNHPKYNSVYLGNKNLRLASDHSAIGGHPTPRCLRSDKKWGTNAYTSTIFDGPRQTVKILIKNGIIKAIYIADFNHDSEKKVIQIKVNDSEWQNIHMSKEECIRLFDLPFKQYSYFTE